MAFKLGLVGLCTSHPQNWVPIIRKLTEEQLVDTEIVSAWDSGETRSVGFAREFCTQHEIPKPVDRLDQMLDLVDGVIIHTANWDRHIEQAKPFIDANKAVFLDKPMVGNLSDANQLLDWAKQNKRIVGGSSLRFADEIREFRKNLSAEGGKILYALAGCGTDEFNYGIHAYSMLSGVMGPGIRSIQYLGYSGQNLLKVTWADGKIGFLGTGKVEDVGGLDFHLTVATVKKGVFQVIVDWRKIYRPLLEAFLPYFTGRVENPPLTMADLLEPELAALAARTSRLHGHAEVLLTDLRQDDPGYDGSLFAREYRRSRLG